MDKRLYKRALRLEYLTVGYNVVEGIVSIVAGWLAGSIALTGFGLDSAVESLSGVVLIWRLKKHGSVPEDEEENAEAAAVRFVGVSFLLLGLYVLYESVKKLLLLEHPEPTLLGILIAALSIITMPVLSYLKLKTARELRSGALEADSKETLVCALLSVALLLGLGLNYTHGLWWADPAAALVIVAFLFKEGLELLGRDSGD